MSLLCLLVWFYVSLDGFCGVFDCGLRCLLLCGGLDYYFEVCLRLFVCVDLILDLRGFFCFGWGVLVWCCVLGFCDIVSLFSSSHVFVITLCFILSGLFW